LEELAQVLKRSQAQKVIDYFSGSRIDK